MPNWKKVIVSGSNAVLNNITASGHMSVLDSGFTVNTHSETELEVVGNISASGGGHIIATSISASDSIDVTNNVTIDNQLETKYRKLNITSTTYDYSGDVVFFGAGSFLEGELLYYNRANANWDTTDYAGGVIMGTSLLGIALGTSPSNGILVRGFITTDQVTDTSGDDALYMGALGDMQTSPPTANSEISRVVGHLLSPANSSPHEIYFNPSPDWIEISS